ncbi:hypothetical protein M6B38_264040 [Iris pallida]|uniref:Pvs-trna-like protein n=1 Tax=Iris pallida TaxID=29817 RepID=A0AAX6IDQ0_IRIPA|nr:hypothetical protein M6B38_264040 [Iris pallida]
MSKEPRRPQEDSKTTPASQVEVPLRISYGYLESYVTLRDPCHPFGFYATTSSSNLPL